MGCKFPEEKEANIYHDPLPTQYAITHWPCPPAGTYSLKLFFLLDVLISFELVEKVR